MVAGPVGVNAVIISNAAVETASILFVYELHVSQLHRELLTGGTAVSNARLRMT